MFRSVVRNEVLASVFLLTNSPSCDQNNRVNSSPNILPSENSLTDGIHNNNNQTSNGVVDTAIVTTGITSTTSTTTFEEKDAAIGVDGGNPWISVIDSNISSNDCCRNSKTVSMNSHVAPLMDEQQRQQQQQQQHYGHDIGNSDGTRMLLEDTQQQRVFEFVRRLSHPIPLTIFSPVIFGEQFVRMTKKMRQQVLTKLFSRLRNQLVVFNVKALFRVYMIYHRDDRLIHAICDCFSKRRIYDAATLRREIIEKNTKTHKRKSMRNRVCNEVMLANPHILRVFDTRTLAYCRNVLLSTADALHQLSNALPVIMCLNERDIDVLFDRCRAAHSRRTDFPVDLLPRCIRLPIARLLAMSPSSTSSTVNV